MGKKRSYDENAVYTIKNSFDVLTACEIAGVEVYNRYGRMLIYCPNPDHNDTHLGNCSIEPKKRFVKCFSCGEVFDVFDIIMLGLGKTFPEAIDCAAEYLNLTHLAKDPKVKAKPAKYRLLSPDEREFLGFARGVNTMMLPYGIREEKPECGPHVDLLRDEKNGDFILCSTETHDFLREKWNKEPDMYRMLVCGKAVEALAHWTRVYFECMISAARFDYSPLSVMMVEETEKRRKKASKLYYEFGGRKSDAESFIKRRAWS